MLNFHGLTDFKVQLNEIDVNNHKSNNLAGSYQGDTGVTERLWRIGFCKRASFELFPERGNRYDTMYIIRKVIQKIHRADTS